MQAIIIVSINSYANKRYWQHKHVCKQVLLSANILGMYSDIIVSIDRYK